MVELSEITENLIEGNAKNVRELVSRSLEEGTCAETILKDGLLSGMCTVGDQFKSGDIFVPEVLIAARAMKAGIEILTPFLQQDRSATGKVCIGTVRGDLHDIGKNLVRILMEGRGLTVIDLGTDVTPARFVEAVKKDGCCVIAMSSLLSSTMNVMGDVVRELEKEGLRKDVFVMVGGAPVTDAYCRTIGADFYSEDAAATADAAVRFCAGRAD